MFLCFVIAKCMYMCVRMICVLQLTVEQLSLGGEPDGRFLYVTSQADDNNVLPTYQSVTSNGSVSSLMCCCLYVYTA